MTTSEEGRDTFGPASGTSSGPGVPDAGLRSRGPKHHGGQGSQAAVSRPRAASVDRLCRYRVLRLAMIQDMQAAHTIVEDMTREQKLQNIMPHFRDLWGYWPLPDRLLEWIEAKELYQHDNVRKLPHFQDFVRSLSDEQTQAILDTRKASPFYFRMVAGRMSRLRRQKMIYDLANKDLRVSCEINLGLFEEERPSNENDYLERLIQKQHMERDKLLRVLEDAILFRDSISSAFEQGALSHDLLPSLRSRISSLHENYSEARKLLDDKRSAALLDHSCEAWFVHRQTTGDDIPSAETPSTEKKEDEENGNRQWKTRVTLAFLTFLFALIVWWPTHLSLRDALDAPGLASDGNFWGLVVSALLQALGLITQLLAPMVSGLLRQAASSEFAAVVWLLALSVVLVTALSLVAYVTISVQFGIFLGVVSQLIMTLLQLLLYFRD